MATAPLTTRGPKAEPKGYITLAFLGILFVIMGRNSGLATSPLHTRGPYARQNGHTTPAFSGVPSTHHGEKLGNGFFTPDLLGGPKPGIMVASLPPSWGSSVLITGRNSGMATSLVPTQDPKLGIMATSPLPFRGSPMLSTGRNSEMRTSPMPTRGPKGGLRGYITPVIFGVPNAKYGEKIRNSYFTPAYPGAQS